MDTFLGNYRRIGAYGIVPIHYIGEMDVTASPSLDLLIIKSELFLKRAWEVNENSPEIAALFEEDDIIIPEGVDVGEVMKRIKKTER